MRGEKAIKALYDFINELEEQRGKELTDKQTDALIKLAHGLISSIEEETRWRPSMPFGKLIPKPVKRLFS